MLFKENCPHRRDHAWIFDRNGFPNFVSHCHDSHSLALGQQGATGAFGRSLKFRWRRKVWWLHRYQKSSGRLKNRSAVWRDGRFVIFSVVFSCWLKIQGLISIFHVSAGCGQVACFPYLFPLKRSWGKKYLFLRVCWRSPFQENRHGLKQIQRWL